MQKISPFFWFDNNAEEAVRFYAAIFKDSMIRSTSRYDKAGAAASGRPEGTVMTVAFQLEGQDFTAINAGPIFKPNPSISFLVACTTREEVNTLWSKLSPGGTPLMELDTYPFSERYGWIQDKYGISWQVMHMGKRTIEQTITPTLMFVGAVSGRAEEAIGFYVSVFPGSRVGDITRYEAGEDPDKPGTIKHAGFILEGQQFAAMDSAHAHGFTFTEGISFVVNCENQEEIDTFWDKLSEGGNPKAQQCGWLKDKFGLSWQIVPAAMGSMMSDPATSQRVMEAMLKMKKIDIAELEKAAKGE